jgi:FlaA1/EpsC-like NDP-sugar epimerase
VSRRISLFSIDIACFCGAYVFNAFFRTVALEMSVSLWLKQWPNLLILLAFVMVSRLVAKAYRNVWRYPNVRAYLTLVVADMCSGGVGYLLTYVLSHQGNEAFDCVYIDFWQTFCVLALFVLSTLVLRFAYQLMHQTRHKGERIR